MLLTDTINCFLRARIILDVKVVLNCNLNLAAKGLFRGICVYFSSTPYLVCSLHLKYVKYLFIFRTECSFNVRTAWIRIISWRLIGSHYVCNLLFDIILESGLMELAHAHAMSVWHLMQ